MYISWNGATEVDHWVVEEGGNGGFGRHTTTIGRFNHEAFETTIPLMQKETLHDCRVTALDVEEKPLGVWVVRKDGTVQASWLYPKQAQSR